VSAYAQAIPEMAAQGQDASGPVRAIADLIAARKKGTPVEKAVSDIFAPPEPEAPAEGEAPVEPGMEAMMGGAPAPGGVDLPQAPPSDNVQQLLSQLSGGGRATSSVRTMRSAAI
jgi:hypothetical protein